MKKLTQIWFLFTDRWKSQFRKNSKQSPRMDDSLPNLAEQRLTKRWFSDVDFRPSPKNKSTIAAGKRSGFLCHLSWSRNVGNWRIRWRLDDGLMAPPWSHRGCTWVQAEWRNATASKQTRTTFDDWGLQAQILNHTVLLMSPKGTLQKLNMSSSQIIVFSWDLRSKPAQRSSLRTLILGLLGMVCTYILKRIVGDMFLRKMTRGQLAHFKVEKNDTWMHFQVPSAIFRWPGGGVMPDKWGTYSQLGISCR